MTYPTEHWAHRLWYIYNRGHWVCGHESVKIKYLILLHQAGWLAQVVTLTPDWEIDIRLICIMKTLPATVCDGVDNMGAYFIGAECNYIYPKHIQQRLEVNKTYLTSHSIIFKFIQTLLHQMSSICFMVYISIFLWQIQSIRKIWKLVSG